MSAATRNGVPILRAKPDEPFSYEAEQNALGVVVMGGVATLDQLTGDGLQAQDFYLEPHQVIFAAMRRLRERDVEPEPATLEEELKGCGALERAGGRAALDLLADGVPYLGNAREYGRIVRDKATRRRLLRATYRAQGALHGGDDQELERALDELASTRASVNGHVDGDVARIRRALLEDAQDTRDATGPAREEVPGTGGLLYRGIAATLFGERGGGKTTAAMVVGMGAAAAGERVLYLDRENGPALTRERIDGILDAHEDWGDPLADDRFVGRHYPDLRADWPPEAFGEAIAGEGFTVVIFDSVREMLTQLGIDTMKGDTSPLIALVGTPLVRRGVSVVLLDNVGHEHKHRPKGDGGKLDAVPQAFQVVTNENFSPVLPGRVTLTCTRSRFGDMDREWTMRVGGGVFEVPAARSEAPDAKAARELREKREKFRKACVTALGEEAPLGRDNLIAAARKKDAAGGNNKLRGWLAELAADPTSGIVSDDREGYQLAAAPLAPMNGATPGPPPAGTPLAPGPPPLRGPGAGHPGPEAGGHPGERRPANAILGPLEDG